MIQKILCALFGHPWLENVQQKDLKRCPCGKSRITNFQLHYAWPGDREH